MKLLLCQLQVFLAEVSQGPSNEIQEPIIKPIAKSIIDAVLKVKGFIDVDKATGKSDIFKAPLRVLSAIIFNPRYACPRPDQMHTISSMQKYMFNTF